MHTSWFGLWIFRALGCYKLWKQFNKSCAEWSSHKTPDNSVHKYNHSLDLEQIYVPSLKNKNNQCYYCYILDLIVPSLHEDSCVSIDHHTTDIRCCINKKVQNLRSTCLIGCEQSSIHWFHTAWAGERSH